jgi:hypothetical protein
MLNEKKLTAAELTARENIIMGMKKNKSQLVKKFGKDAEKVMYGRATNIAKKQAEVLQNSENMKEDKLRKMIQDALANPVNEKKKPFPDLTGDGKITKADILKARGVELGEDLDLGHKDNEPHMIKAELARIGKYAMELYKMVDQFEGPQEVDFPAWWQSKITTASNMISSAKHYLEFELEEPKIDAMVGVEEQLKPSTVSTLSEKILKRLKNNI